MIAYGESIGYHDVWLSEHHFVDDGYSPAQMPIAAAIAMKTKKIRIGTSVVLLPMYDPVRLAEDGATVDILSDGRFELGAGLGYRAGEFEGLGLKYKERAGRMNEALEIIRQLWEGETLRLTPDATLIRGGGHFTGSSMLHWVGGASGRGIVCCSDTAYVAADRAHVTFMRSYPNFLPLPAERVTAIARALAPFEFDKMFGNFFESVIETGAKQAFGRSVERYLAAIAPR